MNENMTQIDQYARKEIAILTGLEYAAGECRTDLESKVVNTISTITGKVFNKRDFTTIHRNGNTNKEDGRPPSVTVKFHCSADKELLFQRNAISKRRLVFPSLNFHHCLCKNLINEQSRILAHDYVKYVRFMGDRRFFDVCILRENDNDAFITHIKNFDHFLLEFTKLQSDQ